LTLTETAAKRDTYSEFILDSPWGSTFADATAANLAPRRVAMCAERPAFRAHGARKILCAPGFGLRMFAGSNILLNRKSSEQTAKWAKVIRTSNIKPESTHTLATAPRV
jgi:hypothetical protein